MADLDRGEALLDATARLPGGEHAVALARALCLAVVVEPALLRRARRILVRGADAGAESDLWFSPLVLSRNVTGLVLDPDVAHALRTHIDADRDWDFADRAYELLEVVHAEHPVALQLEEELNWAAVVRERDPSILPAVQRGLNEAVKAMGTDDDDGRRAARWVADAWRRLPEPATDCEAARMLAAGASLRLGDARQLVSGGERALPPNLDWLAPREPPGDPVMLRVELLGDGLRFAEAGDDDEPLVLPDTSPLVVEITWNGGTVTRAIHPGAEVHLGDLFGAVTLRTLAGRRYILEPEAAPDADETIAMPVVTDELKRACVSVWSAREEPWRLTGCFIAPDLIATYAGIAEEESPLFAQVHGEPRTATLAGRAGQAAALRLDGGTAEVHPLALAPGDEPLRDGTRWVSAAFVDRDHPVSLYGTVDSRGRLDSLDFRHVEGSPPTGFAGAPVVVDGRLIGLIGLYSDGVDLIPVTDIHAALRRGAERRGPLVYLSAPEAAPVPVQLAPLRLVRATPEDPWLMIDAIVAVDAGLVIGTERSDWGKYEHELLRWRRSVSPDFSVVTIEAPDDPAATERAVTALAAMPAERRDLRPLLLHVDEVLESAGEDAIRGVQEILESDPPVSEPAAGRRLAAAGLIHCLRAGETDRAGAALDGLGSRVAEQELNDLVLALAALLVNPDTAAQVRALAERPSDRPALVLNTSSLDIAYCCIAAAWLGEDRPTIAALSTAGEGRASELVEQLQRDLLARMPAPLRDLQGAQDLLFAEPVVAAVGGLPDARTLAELQARLPSTVTLLLLSGPEPPSSQWFDQANAEPLRVPIRPRDEAQILDFVFGQAETPAPPERLAPDGELLARYRPVLQYDGKERFFAVSVALMTDNPGNTLCRKDRTITGDDWTIIAEAGGSLSLEYLGGESYADGQPVGRNDFLHAADLEGETPPRYLDRGYGRVVRESDGGTWLQYWFFFYYDEGTRTLGSHQGDWEHFQIRLGPDERPLAATFGGGDGRSRTWEQCFLEETEDGAALVVFVARGRHSFFPERGRHGKVLTRLYADGFGRKVRPVIEPFGPWVEWPGRWGSTRAGRSPLDDNSPRGPRFHRAWDEPAAYHARAEPLKERRSFPSSFDSG